jgi:hypothetical protein
MRPRICLTAAQEAGRLDRQGCARYRPPGLCVAQSCSIGSVKTNDDLGNEMIKVCESFFSKDAVEQTMLGYRQCLSLAEGNAA